MEATNIHKKAFISFWKQSRNGNILSKLRVMLKFEFAKIKLSYQEQKLENPLDAIEQIFKTESHG